MASHRTDWMAQGNYGLMVHYLVPGVAPERGETNRNVDEVVDGFDLDRFIEEFKSTGADWLIFTIGQNTGHYSSSNAALDRIAGPGHTSRRDLVLEIAQRVKALRKHFIAYLPAEVCAQKWFHEAFAWNVSDQTEFQKRYLQVVADYAKKFGKLLDGWWYDGCYIGAPEFNVNYDWPAWTEASRAGNPDAVIAYNDGSFCIGQTQPLTPLQDYLSGEAEVLRDGKIRLGRAEDAPLYLPESRFVPGTQCQWHALAFIDCFWGHSKPGPMEPPLYSDADLLSLLRSCRSVGGAVTFNVGIYQEGHLGVQTLAQLQRVSAALTGRPAPAAAAGR